MGTEQKGKGGGFEKKIGEMSLAKGKTRLLERQKQLGVTFILCNH